MRRYGNRCQLTNQGSDIERRSRVPSGIAVLAPESVSPIGRTPCSAYPICGIPIRSRKSREVQLLSRGAHVDNWPVGHCTKFQLGQLNNDPLGLRRAPCAAHPAPQTRFAASNLLRTRHAPFPLCTPHTLRRTRPAPAPCTTHAAPSLCLLAPQTPFAGPTVSLQLFSHRTLPDVYCSRVLRSF